jgi:hypothetical protein
MITYTTNRDGKKGYGGFLLIEENTNHILYAQLEVCSANCCAIAALSCMNNYISSREIEKIFEYLANHAILGWDVRQIIFFMKDGVDTVWTTYPGVKKVWVFPSRTEPEHNVAQYSINVGAIPDY